MKRHEIGVAAFDQALDKCVKALRKLDGTDNRPIARRNARKRVLGALRSLRAAVDEEAPAIVVRGKVTRLKSRLGREARLRRAGYVPDYESLGRLCGALRIPMKMSVHKGARTMWIPNWVQAIGPHDVAQLRAAKKNLGLRKAVLAERALRESK